MSRAPERLGIRAKPPMKLVLETFSGPSSYATDGNVYNSTILRQVERAACLQGTGGWRGEVVTGSVSGNAFKLRVWTGTAQPGSTVDLSAQAFQVLLEGL